jgi:L-asparaginase II
MNAEVLCEVYRGGRIESVHHGLLAVVQHGRLVLSKGDVSTPVFARSSVKAFQAYTVLSTGAHEKFGLGSSEIAIMCASHEASASQIGAARSILAKAKIPESNLLCGAHMPQDKETAAELIRAGRRPTAIHNNCSGKHAGMLAACKAAGWPLKGYTDPDHPLQKVNRSTLARFTGVPEKKMAVGVDGCSAPTFALPLERIAIGFEAFFSNRADDRARLVRQAMLSHPSHIGNTCSRLIEAGRGQILCKIGAEGVYGVAFPDADAGLAVKNLDGSFRPLVPVIDAVCKRLKLLRGRAKAAVSELANGVLKNWAGLVTGKLVARV